MLMKYDEWLQAVPTELSEDPLWRNEAYRLAVFAGDIAWADVTKLAQDNRTRSLSDQLFRAVGSVGANIAEGYSRSSGKDEARVLEYALGSAREARNWYYQSRYLLTDTVALHRIRLLTHIIRLLLTMIPRERGRRMAEAQAGYEAIATLLDDPPMPQ
jgi:four helix bundle protein